MCETVHTPRGVKWFHGAWWVPIFCASCGADGGLVPEAHMTFAFYLCNVCSKKYGHLTCTMVEPDAVFWERVAQEQLEKYGRYLTTEEMQEVAAGTSPLSTLLKEGK
jgi:hypothetical protein